MRKIPFLALLLAFLTTFFVGGEVLAKELTVAVSIVPQATFVKAVAGDLVDVVTMIPPGYSPESYAPTPKELTKFSEAAIYFSIGVPTDLVNILPKAKSMNPEIKIVRTEQKIAEIYPEREFEPGERDPHIWLSPKRMLVMIDIIAEELGALDAENQETYLKNAAEYKEKLKQLDQEIKESLTGLSNKTFIIYHPALGYFADDYGLKMVALEEHGKKATAKNLQEIIDLAQRENIKVVFYQKEVDSRQSEALAQEIGGKSVQLDPLAADYIDNLRKTAQLFRQILE